MSAAEGQSHTNVKGELTALHKEAEHQHNVKLKHGEIKAPHAEPHNGHNNPFPELQHAVETGRIEVMCADGKVTGVERNPVVEHPPSDKRE